jgi:CHAD domain-containing protein
MSKSEEVVALCQHLDGLVEELRGRIPQALMDFDQEAIHQARVATRRLKAAIELLETKLDPDHSGPFARLGKKLRRRLGPLRDLDVALGHLDEIKPRSPHGPAVEWIRGRLLRDRLAARERSARKAPAQHVLARLGSWWALRQDVIDASSSIPGLISDSLRRQVDGFKKSADELVHRTSSTPDATEPQTQGPKPDPHELRIAGKNLRYTLELAQAQGHRFPKQVLRTFKRMQKFLGLWHDFVVLAERTMQLSLDEDLALHDPSMQRRVLKFTDMLMGRAQRHLDGFARLWSDQGHDLTQTIRQSFAMPASQLSETETDPGPAGSSAPPARADGSSSSAPAA